MCNLLLGYKNTSVARLDRKRQKEKRYPLFNLIHYLLDHDSSTWTKAFRKTLHLYVVHKLIKKGFCINLVKKDLLTTQCKNIMSPKELQDAC